MIVIKSIKGLKFPLTGKNAGKDGYAYGTGLAFFDNVTKEWIANGDDFPYVPLGGRSGLNKILADSGEFFDVSPRIKSIEV